jgi:hypothetical protein
MVHTGAGASHKPASGQDHAITYGLKATAAGNSFEPAGRRLKCGAQ